MNTQNIIPIPSKQPPEGRACASYQVDLSSGAASIFIDTNVSNLSQVRSIYCGNDTNKDVVCSVEGSQQVLKFAQTSERYLPLISQMPVRLNFTCPLGINKTLTVILLNHDLPLGFGG